MCVQCLKVIQCAEEIRMIQIRMYKLHLNSQPY
jgi:hypothetical protein